MRISKYLIGVGILACGLLSASVFAGGNSFLSPPSVGWLHIFNELYVPGDEADTGTTIDVKVYDNSGANCLSQNNIHITTDGGSTPIHIGEHCSSIKSIMVVPEKNRDIWAGGDINKQITIIYGPAGAANIVVKPDANYMLIKNSAGKYVDGSVKVDQQAVIS